MISKQALDFVSGNFQFESLHRYEGDDFTVSTVWTSDEGFETAILDSAGAHPVERYTTKEDANSGHQKWVDALPTLTEIEKLGGWDGTVPSVQHTLEK